MGYRGYVVKYHIKWEGKRSAYFYQRFFRAIYGYTQVVVKSNGRRYVYYRRGVLTDYPYIKAGKTTVIVPDTAFQPLLRFLKTGKNPAHSFSYVSNWAETVRYAIEETTVDDRSAGEAVLSALHRVRVQLATGSPPALTLIDNFETLEPDQLYALYYSIKGIVGSEWFTALQSVDNQLYERIRKFLKEIYL